MLLIHKRVSKRYILTVFLATFIVAALADTGSEVVTKYSPFLLTWLFLLLVIAIGVVFDILGVAVTAANEAPHNARAARKVFGAKQSVFLIKNADKVANFASDIVGDITGTLSGAMGATLILDIVVHYPQLEINKMFLNILALAVIASVTVTSKALGKTLGINEANRIVDFAGRLIASFEKITRVNLTQPKKKGGKK